MSTRSNIIVGNQQCFACGEREAWEDYARARRFRR